ncbi:MAG: ATP-grasp domain-containing protein [Gammaproteobacteria bacterium]|nr:ATP-grasp domain-containing protein [Gammaproteobacteria bacterium]
MLNVLITSAANKVWLIQAFQQAVRKNGGGLVHAADISANKAALLFADQVFISPKSDQPNFINEIISYCLKSTIKLIVPSRDAELAVFAEHRQDFTAKGIQVMVSNLKTIKLCQDKYLFHEFCHKHKFNNIATFLAEGNYLKEIPPNLFPVYVKPRTGSGSMMHQVIPSPKKLGLFLRFYDDTQFIIQELLKGKEITIDIFSDFNARVLSVVPRQRIDVQHGESYISQTIKNDELIVQCHKLAHKLQLIGHNTIQCFVEDITGAIKFIEVNPRFGGGAALGFAAGHHTPEYLVQLLLYNNIHSITDSYIVNLLLYKYLNNKILLKEGEVYQETLPDKQTFCIDIDGTICTEYCQYEDASPIYSVINKVNHLYQQGHKIILFTSRGYSSKTNWLPLIEKQLIDWGVNYHEIHQGKPYADYYIDNKAIDVLDWV